MPDGEGGKKGREVESRVVNEELSTAPKTRSQNICPVHLIRVPRRRNAEKLLRKKRNESWAIFVL